MENKVKITVTGTHPETGEIHHLEFDGDAVCAVILNDEEDRIRAEECLMGSVNLDRALAMAKGLSSACAHLIESLSPAVSRIVTMEMMQDILHKADDDEQQALKDYDERRAADELA